MVRRIHREVAELIHAELCDSVEDEARREIIAVFSRKAADVLNKDDPSFSYDWFYGACGLDNWGELFAMPGGNR
jgi:hypothetical protein